MSSAKTQMLEIIEGQPEDSSYDEIFRELALERMIDHGLDDERAGRILSNDDALTRICSWQK